VDADAPVTQMDESETDEVRALLRAYADSLPFELDFQGFEREPTNLPGAYAAPRGALLVAHGDGGVAGCVALRPLAGDVCEMKRLFVLPAARGTGLGRRLATAVIDEARRLGFARMRLDTTPGMAVAQGLYDELGFKEIEPYRHNPVAGTKFLELQL
jgi:GNAT superfamily N-acetyltransferase